MPRTRSPCLVTLSGRCRPVPHASSPPTHGTPRRGPDHCVWLRCRVGCPLSHPVTLASHTPWYTSPSTIGVPAAGWHALPHLRPLSSLQEILFSLPLTLSYSLCSLPPHPPPCRSQTLKVASLSTSGPMEYRSVTGPAPLSAVVSAAGPALFVALSEDQSSLCIFDDGEAEAHG